VVPVGHPGELADAGFTGRIGRAVLDGLLAPRRPRVSVRKVKSPLSRWNKADPRRPSQHPVTALALTVSGPETTTQPATAKIPLTTMSSARIEA
jgi:hypothetical protein